MQSPHNSISKRGWWKHEEIHKSGNVHILSDRSETCAKAWMWANILCNSAREKYVKEIASGIITKYTFLEVRQFIQDSLEADGNHEYSFVQRLKNFLEF